MANYWVDPAGDDDDPGTEAEPWQTLNKAATTAVAGDVVTFNDGTYNCGSGQSSWNSGSAGNVITFQADNSRQAILQTTSSGWIVELDNDDYITFDGLVFDGNLAYSIGRFVSLDTCDNITFNDCELTDTQGRVLAMWGGCTNISVIDCEIHPETTYPAYPDHACIHIRNAGNDTILIDGCEIYHASHEGIRVHAGENITIQNCTVYEHESHCISFGYADGTNAGIENIIVRDNVMYGGGGWPDFEGGFHFGLRIAQYTGSIEAYRNDIYYNEAGGIVILDSADGPIEIYNNTLYDNNQEQDHDAGDILMRNMGEANPTVTIKNNIVYNTGSEWTLSIEDSSWNPDMDYNLYFADNAGGQIMYRGGSSYATYAAYQAAGYEPNTVINDNPDFTNAGAADFTLQVGSPAIDAGTGMGLPYYGSAPDIGAHEYEPGPGPGGVTVVYTVVIHAPVVLVPAFVES